MAVRVGHLQDPNNLPGLAHFLVRLPANKCFLISGNTTDSLVSRTRSIYFSWEVPNSQEKMNIVTT
jgi:hypothetical protein